MIIHEHADRLQEHILDYVCQNGQGRLARRPLANRAGKRILILLIFYLKMKLNEIAAWLSTTKNGLRIDFRVHL